MTATRRQMTWPIAVAVLVSGAVPVPAAADMRAQVPRYILSVRNTTTNTLTCRLQVVGNAAETFLFIPKQEWQRRVTRTNAVASMTCAAPVRAVLFKIVPGRRYVLVRGGKDMSVDLRDASSAL